MSANNPTADRTGDVEFPTDPKATSTTEPEQFRSGMPIPFGRDSNRDVEYNFQELHNAPNKDAYKAHLESIPNRERLPEEKKNLRTLKKQASRISHQNQGDGTGYEVVNEWHKNLSRNSPCPCASGKKWKKCHMNVVDPRLPMEAYYRKPGKEDQPKPAQ